MKRLVLILLATITIFCNPLIGAQKLDNSLSKIDRDSCLVHFRIGSSLVEKDYLSNNSTFQKLNTLLLDSTYRSRIVSITTYATTSPDGILKENELLARKRSVAIRGYLRWSYPWLKTIIINTNSDVNQWSGLIPYIEKDNTIPHKNIVLNILQNSGDEAQTIVREQLKDIDNGLVWRYILKHYLPYFRSGWCVINTLKVGNKKEIIAEIEEPVVVNIPTDTLPANHEATPPSGELDSQKTEYFALKTNLLFDALLMPNIEIEVPIGDRFSIAGEWMFPWWIGKNNDKALQVLSGTVEGRYWFGNRTERRKMTGWFAGLYAGGGLYDLQNNSKGYQGEFFIAAGLSGGYAHTINKRGNLRMEYSLGVGYLKTNYRYYVGMEDNKYLVWQNDGNYSWVGPTKLEVSLVWMLNFNRKRGGTR